jgi:hypothetical protein
VSALIEPPPPCVPAPPGLGAVVPFLRNPTASLGALRAAHGETFDDAAPPAAQMGAVARAAAAV